jgi:hypothetical protein
MVLLNDQLPLGPGAAAPECVNPLRRTVSSQNTPPLYLDDGIENANCNCEENTMIQLLHRRGRLVQVNFVKTTRYPIEVAVN